MKALLSICFSLLGIHLLQAQELALPGRVNLFQHSESVSNRLNIWSVPDARIWGWSSNGRLAYSLENQVDGRGGQIIDFVIIDLISDNTLFELKIDSFDEDGDFDDDLTFEILYRLYENTILEALGQHNIVGGQINNFLSFPFRRNNMSFNGSIVDLEHINDRTALFDRVVSRYSVLVTRDMGRKIAANLSPVYEATGYIYVCGYFLSPFEDRIMLVVAEEAGGMEETRLGTRLIYRFIGCHLGVGFN